MYLIFKKVFDIIFSVIVLLLVAPVLLFSIIVIKLESKGPILFLQDRLGKDGSVFRLYKFRTMINKNREVNREILKGDEEVTKSGYYLRRFKIDELPQLINVLKGDMSLVGPRPCMPELQDSFNEDGKFRIRVLPGLTGLAQVNGNIYLSWPQRWKYDREYVEKISFLIDISIILKTIGILLFGEEKFKKDE
jgi:undecaprenyl phosphate N,N'-diacetylbacillosamine 1-phosphate transferase